MSAAARVGLLGGTFDPPHYGHLIFAQEAAWQLHLDRVLFLPARQNPLKRGEPTSAPEHRLRMVELAVREHPGGCFQVSRADLDRPPPSYTVDLLRLLRDECGPGAELYFLGGADLLPELPSWYQPGEILQLATLVIANRPGWPDPLGVEEQRRALLQKIPGVDERRIVALKVPGTDISSSDLRERVGEGRPIRYLTPPVVEQYIVDHGLYASATNGAPRLQASGDRDRGRTHP